MVLGKRPVRRRRAACVSPRRLFDKLPGMRLFEARLPLREAMASPGLKEWLADPDQPGHQAEAAATFAQQRLRGDGPASA